MEFGQTLMKPQNKYQKTPKYSFPKNKRFNDNYERQKIKKSICDKIYQLPETLSKQGTSLGYGNKSQLTIGEIKNPGPGAYNINKSLVTKYGINMGLGREQITFNNLFPKVEFTIGPGQYSSLNDSLSKVSYTMRQRPKDLKCDVVPGPGKYELESSITKDGRHISSSIKNSECVRFNPISSRRFIDLNQSNLQYNFYIQESNQPGIGTYNIKLEKQNQKGVYVLSNFLSINPISIPKQKRITFDDQCKTPGPGAYKLPSLI